MKKNDALIHLRVPADKKNLWVRESQNVGMRLTEWITKAVELYIDEQHTKKLKNNNQL